MQCSSAVEVSEERRSGCYITAPLREDDEVSSLQLPISKESRAARTWQEAYVQRASVYFSSIECAKAGSWRHIFLILGQSLEWPPSTEQATSVQGAPMKPIRDVFPSVSFLRVCQKSKYRMIKDYRMKPKGKTALTSWELITCKIGPRKGTCCATSCIGFSAATSSFVLIGFNIFGPLPGMIVKSTPRAGRGVKISGQHSTAGQGRAEHESE